ncbi:hypothetical protein Glove_115g16 [Diversispora epigaea]|uniref:Uncharacterized protein n=1 Tax=Diversispora epigaea TaxID=1348612 RepID=A0A397J7K1_9GLOM|nr:hypothetical protein Glove_115g16 [Diversispora epigaea]
MQDEYLQNQNEINNLLLDINIPLEFDDNDIATEEPLTDDQIIEMVLEENNFASQNINDESDNEETPTVSMKEGLVSLKKWISFFEQQNSDDFCFEDLIKFKKYVRIIEKMEFASKKQTKLDSVFSTDMSFETTEVDILNSNYEMNENFEITEVDTLNSNENFELEDYM